LSKYVKGESGEKYLKLAHDKAYIERVKRVGSLADTAPLQDDSPSGKAEYLDADTYVVPGSYEAACDAVGCAVKAAKTNAFAVIRPPGHHAPFGGFCLFNNMAIAAKALKKRVLVCDIDAHHGNGSQALLAGDDQFAYFSSHQSPLYPGTGLVDEGNAVNAPLPAGAGDKEFAKAVDAKLAPLIKRFEPEVVGVSAGFDSYYKDAGWLTDLRFTLKSYERVLQLIEPFDCFFVLEGGYNPASVKDGVEFVLGYFR
jgi:acetoin utilization deacetylase AcuC-like enzyme